MRRPVSGIEELSQVNSNVVKLSRVIGASSGVPGVFPPTTISGDVLVDGGVADNQGIEVLIDPVDLRGSPQSSCVGLGSRHGNFFDVLIVSDASGQFELAHRVGQRIPSVLRRTISVLQYQSRERRIQLLRAWKNQGADRVGDQDTEDGGEVSGRSFAFMHLFLNLKDRGVEDRVPSEFIPALARIRTDLDQFSRIERETLMYHGYTLIDAQLKRHCKQLWQSSYDNCAQGDLVRPPLFADGAVDGNVPDKRGEDGEKRRCDGEMPNRRRIKHVLAAGRHSLFLLRSGAKHPRRGWALLGSAMAVAVLVPLVGADIGVSDLVEAALTYLYDQVGIPIGSWLASKTPAWMQGMLSWLWRCVDDIVAQRVVWQVVGLALWLYLMLFLTFEAMRIAVCRWDQQDYEKRV